MTRSTPVIAVMITFSIALARADLASASASRMGAQQTDETQPVSIVQNFLLARDMGDFSGAESWCAPLLELQDDDSWFVDQPTMGDWLRRLTDEYIIDTVSNYLNPASRW